MQLFVVQCKDGTFSHKPQHRHTHAAPLQLERIWYYIDKNFLVIPNPAVSQLIQVKHVVLLTCIFGKPAADYTSLKSLKALLGDWDISQKLLDVIHFLIWFMCTHVDKQPIMRIAVERRCCMRLLSWSHHTVRFNSMTVSLKLIFCLP